MMNWQRGFVMQSRVTHRNLLPVPNQSLRSEVIQAACSGSSVAGTQRYSVGTVTPRVFATSR